MPTFLAGSLTPMDNYKLLSGSVVPRPIAWISTVDAAGVRNLAPYSFFNAVCGNPPVICFCPAIREKTEQLREIKDTLANVRATGEFVVNIVSDALAERMNQTAAQLPPEADEFEAAGLTAVPGQHVRAPRVGEAPVQMECRLRQIVEISTLPGGSSLVLGEVVCWHIRDEVWREGMHVLPEALDAVGRMAGATYVRTRDRFDLRRPG